MWLDGTVRCSTPFELITQTYSSVSPIISCYHCSDLFEPSNVKFHAIRLQAHHQPDLVVVYLNTLRVLCGKSRKAMYLLSCETGQVQCNKALHTSTKSTLFAAGPVRVGGRGLVNQAQMDTFLRADSTQFNQHEVTFSSTCLIASHTEVEPTVVYPEQPAFQPALGAESDQPTIS